MKRNAVNETGLQGSDCRINAHTRLRESKMKKMHTKSIQELAAAAAAICGQESDCRNNAHLVMSILNAIQKNISVHKFHIRSKRQVLSCSFTAEARACSRTTTKKHR